MGCAYAISWNNKTYQDYKTAYYDVMKDAKNPDDPASWSSSWQIFFASHIDPATKLRDASFHSDLKRRKDYFRRYRDLSIIISVAIYGIVVADAYVDAQLFDFDISPDLSFRITPEYMPATFYHARSYGINLCMNF